MTNQVFPETVCQSSYPGLKDLACTPGCLGPRPNIDLLTQLHLDFLLQKHSQLLSQRQNQNN